MHGQIMCNVHQHEACQAAHLELNSEYLLTYIYFN